jgi:hypothetical protein
MRKAKRNEREQMYIIERLAAEKILGAVCVIILLLFTASPAKRESDPGPGTGASDEIGENSALARSGSGTVNLLTGQPEYHIKLFSMDSKSGYNVGVDLHYGGNFISEVKY